MIKIREIEEKDLIPVSEFLPKGFACTTKEFWLQLFEFWWITNPAFTSQIPRGWVLEKDMSIIGFMGNIPVKFLIHGEVKIAGASNSWYVDPSVRGTYSFRLFNEFMKQKDASLFLFKANDERFAKILSKYKFDEYILPRNQKEYAYIIDKNKITFNFIKFIFDDEIPKLHKIPELCRRSGLLILSYLYQKQLVLMRNLPAYTVSLCTSCDDAFSTICQQNLRHCDVTISHDIKTLNWLYFSSSRCNERVVIQCRRSQDATLAGYMVFDILRDKRSGGGIMQLMDLCIEDKNPQVLTSLISFAIEFGKRNGAALLVVWANNEETETYFQSTFTLERSVQNYRYIKFSEPPEMNSGKVTYGKVCLPLIYPPQ